MQCNRLKGTNIASIDPITKAIVRLFDPRRDNWSMHFRTERGRIVPITPIGRATAALLDFQQPDRERIRENLWAVGQYPPKI